jgi:hypothetical protein
MNQRWRSFILLTAVVSAGLTGPAIAQAEQPETEYSRLGLFQPTAVGLTSDQRLVKFRVNHPSSVKVLGRVGGLAGDTRLVGIDYRVQDRQLYGVGDQGGIYLFSGTQGNKVSQLTVALSGQNFGVDFNPAADRLRIVSDNGQNLRHDLTGGTTIADTTLTYAPATAPVAGVTAAAYTNNDLDATTGTTLFDLDTTLDQIALQSPANAGLLALTGKLGVDAGADAGFDIYTKVSQGKAKDASGYAALSVNGSYRLYSINLFTGAASSQGAFPGSAQVTDLAIQLD